MSQSMESEIILATGSLKSTSIVPLSYQNLVTQESQTLKVPTERVMESTIKRMNQPDSEYQIRQDSMYQFEGREPNQSIFEWLKFHLLSPFHGYPNETTSKVNQNLLVL